MLSLKNVYFSVENKNNTDLKKTTLFLLLASLAIALLPGCKTQKPAQSSVNSDENVPVVPNIYDDDMPSGVPAYPGVISYELPDGYVLEIVLKGDEHQHTAETADGYSIVLNPEGFYEYTFQDDQGLPQPTGVIARNPEDRSEEDWRILKSLP